MSHPNAALAERLYGHFSRGEIEAVLALCHDDVVFSIPGKTRISGRHTKATAAAWVEALNHISGGTFHEDILDILVSEERVLLFLDHRFQRDGRPVQYHTAHLWRVRDGLFAALHVLPLDLDAFERAWK